MAGDIANRNAEPVFSLAVYFYKVKKITTGFITVDAFSGNIESGDFWHLQGKKILLNLHGNIQRLFYPDSVLKLKHHLIKAASQFTNFILSLYGKKLSKIALGNSIGG